MESEALSLYQLLSQTRLAIREAMPQPNWITAEISELRVNFSGHCYLELIEKEPEGSGLLAKARATIWASAYRMIKPYFESVAQTQLTAGLRVMIRAQAEFHELFGFSLNISDIEPAYTLGDMARQKQEVIRRLKAEGVFEMNCQLSLAEIPARIAVVSSKTAAGLGDFLHQLHNNAFGYRFQTDVFPAVMQGSEAEASVISALETIAESTAAYDAVLLLRGGGAVSELSCFDSYLLNFYVCQFPLPVITGIGHERDETVADLVAHTSLKTPTAVAEFLIARFRLADESINQLSAALTNLVAKRVQQEKDMLGRYLLRFRPAVRERLIRNKNSMDRLAHALSKSAEQLLLKETARSEKRRQRLEVAVRQLLQERKHIHDSLEKKISYLDPFVILKRGYSITYLNGRVLKQSAALNRGTTIETRLADGTFFSQTL